MRPLPEWARLVQEVKNGIGYLRNRLTGNCEANYDCTQLFEVYRLVQAFDPSFAFLTSISRRAMAYSGSLELL